MIRSLVAGALIGFADAVPMDARRLRRPLEVVWRDDRDLPDPLDGVPLMILDPIPLERHPDARLGPGRTLRLGWSRPFDLLRRLGRHLSPG